MTETPVIIVGVDDSFTSRHALSWAAAEATQLGAAIEAVTIYDEAHGPHARAEAEAVQDRVIEDILGTRPVHPVAKLVVAGDPVDVLTMMSSHAHLLVIGRHSTAGLRHSADSSTAEQCARLAECPVTIVPGTPVLTEPGEVSLTPPTLSG